MVSYVEPVHTPGDLGVSLTNYMSFIPESLQLVIYKLISRYDIQFLYLAQFVHPASSVYDDLGYLLQSWILTKGFNKKSDEVRAVF